jgi:hypothetical protein
VLFAFLSLCMRLPSLLSVADKLARHCCAHTSRISLNRRAAPARNVNVWSGRKLAQLPRDLLAERRAITKAPPRSKLLASYG